WIKDNGKWYYADEYGYIKVNVTDKVGNKFYIFDK
ncbi:CAP domain-containing protein, partial [Clostridium tertium]